MDSWHDVQKGLFVVDADVESSQFLARMVDVARELVPASPWCTASRVRSAGAVPRRRRSMTC